MLHGYRNQSIELQSKSINWFLHQCNMGPIGILVKKATQSRMPHKVWKEKFN